MHLAGHCQDGFIPFVSYLPARKVYSIVIGITATSNKIWQIGWMGASIFFVVIFVFSKGERKSLSLWLLTTDPVLCVVTEFGQFG